MIAAEAQTSLFSTETAADRASSTNFARNMSLPVHRWFRYSAGYSAAWVERVIRQSQTERTVRVLDPFAGSGTTLLAAQAVGAESIGFETHSFVARVARAKLAWPESATALEARAAEVLSSARPSVWLDPPALMEKIYEPQALADLCGLRRATETLQDGSEIDELVWLALVAILRVCSPVGTAPWQYVLPNKTKRRVAHPIDAFSLQVSMMAADMRALGDQAPPETTLVEADARDLSEAHDDWANLVVTSPPYPNNYDYADSTRIEMTFLGTVRNWGDLQEAVRHRLVRSCSQHMSRFDAEPLLELPSLQPIASELEATYRRLAMERELHGGKKNYHAMVVAYFADLAQTWQALRRACSSGAEVLFVVGDSAPYGVHVPVDRWLGELALASGFDTYEFEKLRDRNVKWKNRKHRVPLHEGVLRVKG